MQLIQLKKDVLDLLPNEYTEKISCYDSSETSQVIPECGVMLIDEYDKTLENLISVNKALFNYELCGLEAIRKAPRVIVFSATDNHAWDSILEFMRIPEGQGHQYPSRYSVS